MDAGERSGASCCMSVRQASKTQQDLDQDDLALGVAFTDDQGRVWRFFNTSSRSLPAALAQTPASVRRPYRVAPWCIMRQTSVLVGLAHFDVRQGRRCGRHCDINRLAASDVPLPLEGFGVRRTL